MVAENRYERSELNWLVYNAPVDYVNLLLLGDIVSRHLGFYKTCFRPLLRTPLKNWWTCISTLQPTVSCGFITAPSRAERE